MTENNYMTDKSRNNPIMVGDWRWRDNPNILKLFTWLLQNAETGDRYLGDLVMTKGELMMSLEKMAEETGLSPKMVRTALRHLQSTGEISTRRYTFHRIISIHPDFFDCYLEGRSLPAALAPEKAPERAPEKAPERAPAPPRRRSENRVPLVYPYRVSGARSRSVSGDRNRQQAMDGFVEFISAYPVKQYAAEAVWAWRKYRLGEDKETRALVMKRLEEWKASKSWARENGRFIPLAKNWLFGRRWEEDPAEEDRKREGMTKRAGLLPAQCYTQRVYSREEEEAEKEAFFRALMEKSEDGTGDK